MVFTRLQIATAGLTAALTLSAGCAKPAPDPLAQAVPAVVKPGTTLTADPDPISDADGNGLGETLLKWSTTAKHIRMCVNAPDGPALGEADASGTMRTGRWVTNGMKFYLQDRDAPNPSSEAATLGRIAIVVQ